jgi:hypothetical protein
MTNDPNDPNEPRERGYAARSDRGMKWPLIIGAVVVVLILIAWAGGDRGGWMMGEDATDADATPNVSADVTPSDPVD